MKLHFSGRNALILGGSCDLAICLAECLMESSLFPILTYRNEKGERRISEKLENYSEEYSSCYLDFGRRDSLESLFGKTGDDIDFVIDFVQGDLESFIAAADSYSVFHYFSENVSFRAEILKRVSRGMLKKKRGRLVFISSSAAMRPNPGQGLELGRRGITTVTLRPGYIDAGRGRHYLQAHEKEVLKMVPINRAISEREVAETILFLLSDSARGFNATEITMDGGLAAGK